MEISQSKKYFWWFVLVHCTLWMIIPAVMRYALPHDTIEGAMWGQHLEWGYDKNPWMNAWLTRLGWEIGGTSGIGIYAISSFFVGLSFWSVWKLAGKILSPLSALISVFLLEACINYTLVPQGFNDNVIELGLWPLMFLCFYNALYNDKNNPPIKYWIFTGLIAGLAMMAKYYTGVPLVIMALYLLTRKEGRISFRSSGLYLGALVFVLVILPNVIWLFQHDFMTIKYAFNRADNLQHDFWILHLYYPFDFAYTQLLDFLLAIILLVYLSASSSRSSAVMPAKDLDPANKLWNDNRSAKAYILFMALGPFVLTIILAMLFGWHLYNEWGVPLVALWGLLLILIFKPEISEKKFKKFMMIIYIIMFLWMIGYIAGLFINSKHKHSDNYPAKEIAHYVTTQWQEKYHKPLKYVAGSRYVGGYIAFYSHDHPSVYVEWNQQFSPWINLAEMKKYGAVFIQDNYYGTTVFGKHPYTNNGKEFPAEVLKQYPDLMILPVKYFNWKRGNKHDDPIPVLIGFLPPQMIK